MGAASGPAIPGVIRPVPRLLHPQHAVHALHRAAGPERVPQHRRHPVVRRPAPPRPARGHAPPRGPAPSAGPPSAARRCRSHHRQAIASRHSGRGSADSSRRCIRSRKFRLRRSVRKLRTFDQSGAGQALQGLGDLGLGVAAVVEPAIGPEQVQRGVGPAPGRFRAARPARTTRSPGARRRGRPGPRPGHRSLAVSTAATSRVGGLGLLPGRLGTPPVPGQDPLGLHRGVEDVQAVLQGRGLGVVAAGRGQLRDRLGDPLGGVGDGELQAVERAPVASPRSRPCGRRCSRRRRRSCSPARSRPGSVAPKKDLVHRERPDPGDARRVERLQDGLGLLGGVGDPACRWSNDRARRRRG